MTTPKKETTRHEFEVLYDGYGAYGLIDGKIKLRAGESVGLEGVTWTFVCNLDFMGFRGEG
jgi:hypothetical protein